MTLNSLLAGLRRRWLVVVAFIALGGLAGAAYAAVSTPVYQGETSLFVSLQTTTTNSPSDLVAGNNFAAQKVPSYVEIVSSQRVLGRVAAEIGADPATIGEDVEATVLPNSAIITITGSSTNPTDAATLTNAVATVFADIVVNEIESPVGGGPGPVKVEILASAEPPEDPISPDILLALALGLFGGFVIGGAVAIVLTLTDRRVRYRADVTATVDRPVLGEVSSARSGSAGLTTIPMTDFRSLAATVAALAHRQPFASVAVASPTAPAPAAETAAGLGQALAESGLRTVVIDAVFDGGGVSEYFGAEDLVGLRDVLAGTSRLSEAVASTSLHRLRVLPLGGDETVTSSALSGPVFTAVIEQLSASADFLVINAGAVLGGADALAARASADQAIVAIDAGRTSSKQLTAAVEQLEIIGTPLLGVVVAKRKRRITGERVRATAAGGPGAGSGGPAAESSRPGNSQRILSS